MECQAYLEFENFNENDLTAAVFFRSIEGKVPRRRVVRLTHTLCSRYKVINITEDYRINLLEEIFLRLQ